MQALSSKMKSFHRDCKTQYKLVAELMARSI